MTDLIERENLPETLQVKVTPKASSNRIVQEMDTDGNLVLKVYVTTVPENGKANQAVIKLLSKHLKLSKSSLRIIRGHNSREKTIQVLT